MMRMESGKSFVERWRRAGRLLDERRREALASMTDDEARAGFLLLFQDWHPPARNRTTSGLVQLHQVLDRHIGLRREEGGA